MRLHHPIRPTRSITIAAAVLLAATACSSPGDRPDAEPDEPHRPVSSTGAAGPGGTAEEPAPVKPSVDLLEWEPVAGSVERTVIQTAHGQVARPKSRTKVEYPGGDLTAPKGFVFNDLVTDGTHLVAVAQDKTEEQPARATVVDLSTGETTTYDGDSEVPTTNGGAWALGDGNAYHATFAPSGAYCLAVIDLGSGESKRGWCAGDNAGFSSVAVSPAGTSMLTFAGIGPEQCRTAMALSGPDTVAPLPGPTKCAAWDSLLTPGGAVWSVVPNLSRVEFGEFVARSGADHYALGAGDTGTLTWCGDSAWFVRSVQSDRGKARLIRWQPETHRLTVAYESPGLGQAFIAEPRCAGDRLTITNLGEGGDEQVWAPVG